MSVDGQILALLIDGGGCANLGDRAATCTDVSAIRCRQYQRGIGQRQGGDNQFAGQRRLATPNGALSRDTEVFISWLRVKRPIRDVVA